MRVIALVLAVSAVALARPQFQLSNKGYEGLQLALDGRVPVAISSGQLLYSAVDNGNDLVVVDLGRPGGPGPAPATFVGADIGDNLIRTDPNSGIGAGINEFGQNVLQFGQGALGFVGDVAVGIGEVAEGTLQGFADLTGIADIRSPDSTFRSLSEGGAPANTVAAAPAGPDLGAAIGQGALLFGQGVLDAVGEVSVGLGQAAEETLRSLSEGVQASSRQAAPAVIIVDEAASPPQSDLGTGLNDIGQGVLQFGLGIRDALSDGVGVVGQVAEDTLQGFADLTGIADIGATNTVAAEEAPVFRSAIEVAPVEVAPIEVAALDFPYTTAGLAAAVARTGPVAIEDTAVVALAAPEEAIVAPAAPEAVGVSLAAVTRRKRQVLEEEKPISNARAIGSGLSTLGGLFGSTVGQFMDSVAVAAVEMIDGLENLGTIAIDQVENRFDDNPDNDFFKR